MSAVKTEYDLCIVSHNERHHHLAEELSRQNWKVALIDVRNQRGAWKSADLVNPFGLSVDKRITPENLEYYNKTYSISASDKAFTLKFKNRVFESNTEIEPYVLKREKISSSQKNSFNYVCSSTGAELFELKKMNLADAYQDFENSNLLMMTGQIASNNFKPHYLAHHGLQYMPIFNDWKKLNQVQSKDQIERSYEYFRLVNLESLVQNKQKRFEIQIQAAKSNSLNSLVQSSFIQSRLLIWGLSTEETEFCFPKLTNGFFDSKILQADWNWQSFRFRMKSKIKDQIQTDSWPKHFYICFDPRLEWTHENLLLVNEVNEAQKASENSHVYDVFLRIPNIFRFNSSYHQELAEKLQKNLNDLFSGTGWENLSLPIESELGREKLGPSIYPIFDAQKRMHHKRLMRSNLFYDSSEEIMSYQLQIQILRQQEYYRLFMQMRDHWINEELKKVERAKKIRKLLRRPEL